MGDHARVRVMRRPGDHEERDDDGARLAHPERAPDPELARRGDRATAVGLQQAAGNSATARLVAEARSAGAPPARDAGARHAGADPASGAPTAGSYVAGSTAAVHVQRDDLDAALAGIDDDAANLNAILAQADLADARSAFQRGVAAFRAHRYIEAGRLFEEAAGLAPAARSDLLFNAARAYQEAAGRGRPRPEPGVDAEASARTALAAGSEAFRSGDFATAIAEFRRALAAVPAPEIEWNLGMAYFRAGRPAEAMVHFEAYAATSGSSAAAAWIRRCERAAQSSNDISERDLAILGESEEQSIEAIVGEASQSDAQADFAAGATLFGEGDFSGAAARFASAASAMPDTPEMAFNTALANMRAGNHEAAIAGFKRYLGIGG